MEHKLSNLINIFVKLFFLSIVQHKFASFKLSKSQQMSIFILFGLQTEFFLFFNLKMVKGIFICNFLLWVVEVNISVEVSLDAMTIGFVTRRILNKAEIAFYATLLVENLSNDLNLLHIGSI